MIHWDCVKSASETIAVIAFGLGGIVGLVSGLAYLSHLSETRPKLAVTVFVGLALLALFIIDYAACVSR
jgi:Na+/H+ antiporter NhaC